MSLQALLLREGDFLGYFDPSINIALETPESSNTLLLFFLMFMLPECIKPQCLVLILVCVSFHWCQFVSSTTFNILHQKSLCRVSAPEWPDTVIEYICRKVSGVDLDLEALLFVI